MNAAAGTPAAPAPAALPQRRTLADWLGKDSAVAIAAIVTALAMQLHVALARAVNWDEFWHYTITVRYTRGELTDPLQTAFAPFFAWVTVLPGSGVDHIVTIRLFMWACQIITALAIAGTAARFAGRMAGLLCALLYLSAAYVLQHGTSFRFDPPAAALLSVALWVLATRPLRWGWLVLAGVLTGASTLLTMKSVLYASAFAGVGFLRWSEARFSVRTAMQLALVPVSALGAFALLYWLHAQGLAGDTGTNAEAVIDRSSRKMFVLGVPPYWKAAVKAAVLSPLHTAALLAAPVVIWASGRPLAERIALTGLWLPLTTLLFYHNTAPYYHVFMLAPVAMALAGVIAPVLRRYDGRLVAGVLLVCAAFVLWREPESPLERQRTLVATAERIFPAGTAYFDSNGMVGKLEKANAFMTPWGAELYRNGAYPSLVATAAQRPVPLVIDNDWMFTEALNGDAPVAALLPQDTALLRSAYVRFWGPFWIAGFDLEASTAVRPVNVAVPGPYTLTSAAPVMVDGTLRQPGEVFTLARGAHRIGPSASPVSLRWGDRIAPPAQPAPPEPYFTGF